LPSSEEAKGLWPGKFGRLDPKLLHDDVEELKVRRAAGWTAEIEKMRPSLRKDALCKS